jgi:hypothetical protein
MNNQFDDEPLLDATDEIPREAFNTAVAPEEIRDRAWRATSGYLRRRRIMRGALRMSAAAALFVCGIAVGVMGSGMAMEPDTNSSQEPASALPAAQKEPTFDDLLRDGEAFALLVKQAPKEEQLALLRRAGDRYLSEDGDVKIALRCYRQMLDIADSPQALEADKNDSWLLMALKSDRQREKQHAEPNA